MRRDAECNGFMLTEAEFESLLQYTARKCRIAEKDEDYFLLLLEDEIKDYYFRITINEASMAIMASA